jgi:hypothetical protein
MMIARMPWSPPGCHGHRPADPADADDLARLRAQMRGLAAEVGDDLP